MARINNLRVDERINYINHIKGKRLIRLSAGVCSGKNYWVVKAAKEFPDLRILLITSRKNTVLAQAKKMGASTFLDFDIIVDDDFAELHEQKLKRVVCTNKSIENFFKTKYMADNSNTHLWDKFDLIVLDEAHALTTDATFTECFYTERFLKHAYYKNPNCDIIFMSGTLTPLKWMLDAKNTPKIYDLDLFDDCVHLEPDNVFLINESAIKKYIYNLWLKGERLVYFANYKATIAELTTALMDMGVPASELGFSFNYDVNDDLEFPDEIACTIEKRIEDMNCTLVSNEIVPKEIKILFTTSKNKEGINILDDDIKIVFAETHSKSELTQIAGRVRGNPKTGQGINRLVIISDAKQFNNNFPDEFTYAMNKNVAEGLTSALKEYTGDLSCADEYLKKLNHKERYGKAFKYIRYDYIGEKYCAYEGRIEGERQYRSDINEFKEIVRDSVLRKDSSGKWCVYTGYEILKNEWFKWSDIYILHKEPASSKEEAKRKLREFLKENGYIGAYITKKIRDNAIKTEIIRLAEIYGYKTLGLKKNFKTVGDALRKFDLKIVEKVKKTGCEKFEIVELNN